MKMTRQIIHYIQDNALSVEAISQATGVEQSLFYGQRSRGFNATEMLELCRYLKRDPDYFWEKAQGGQEK